MIAAYTTADTGSKISSDGITRQPNGAMRNSHPTIAISDPIRTFRLPNNAAQASAPMTGHTRRTPPTTPCIASALTTSTRPTPTKVCQPAFITPTLLFSLHQAIDLALPHDRLYLMRSLWLLP